MSSAKPDARKEDIVIVGAGIAGLATAVALQRFHICSNIENEVILFNIEVILFLFSDFNFIFNSYFFSTGWGLGQWYLSRLSL